LLEYGYACSSTIGKKRLVPAKGLCQNSIEKLKCLLGSRRLEVKDSEIRDMALLIPIAGTKFWCITHRMNCELMRKNLGEWSVVLSEATRKK